MNLQNLRVRSLKARMTLTTLALLLVSMWALVYYASTTLRLDMERMLGHQQSSSVSLIAGQINDALNDRIQALQAVAAEVTPAMLAKPATLQTLLETRPLLLFFFNGGVFITGIDGIAVADLPVSAGRMGVNYLDRASVSTALKQGDTLFSRPSIGKKLSGPIFSISAPIHGSGGKVLGVLVGTINLSLPNFLDKLTQNANEQPGRYLIIARDSRLVVTATEKHRIMQPILGKTAMVQRYLDGYEGTDVFINNLGVEVLSSVKAIPVANWYLAASLPTAEAFAPIYAMQQRMLLATIVLSALACGLTWWLTRHHLFPVVATVEKLAVMANEKVPLAPLLVPEHTEVGALIAGVNKVLKTLELRETALVESDAFRNAIIDSVAAKIAVLDCHGVIAAVNQSWRRFGAVNAKAPGVAGQHTEVGSDYLKVCRAAIGTVDEVIALQAAQGIQAVLDRNLDVFTMEYPCHAPGENRWFMMIVTPLDRSSGGAVVAHNDITNLKSAEEKIRESEQRLTMMQLGAADGFWDLDLTRNEMYYSAQWWRMLGYGDDEHSTDPTLWLRMLHPDDVDKIKQAFNAIVSSSVNVGEAEFRLRHKDGHYVAVACRGVISRGEDGKAIRVSGSNLDLTERKWIEAEMRSAKAAADRANDEKSHFLAAVSHDLRQPLMAIALYVDMLNADAPENNAKMLPRLKDCVRNLSELLAGVLDLSKLQAGAVVAVPSSFLVSDVLNALQSVHTPQTVPKGLCLRVRPTNLTVRTDRTLLLRLLGNLVANAVQYTSTGGVLIACRRHAQRHWLEVYDTGIGIPEDKIHSMFGEFHQMTSLVGSGLGLYVAARTAELLGLQIRVRSVVGRGSMFAVELPVSDPILTRNQPHALPSETKLRVALVDDNTEVLQALTLTLEQMGHEVVAASNGRDAIARLDGQAPDLLITDYCLAAGETGDEVIEDARAIFGETLPAFIITADTQKAPFSRLAEEHILVIFKPVHVDALRVAISQVMTHDRV